MRWVESENEPNAWWWSKREGGTAATFQLYGMGSEDIFTLSLSAPSTMMMMMMAGENATTFRLNCVAQRHISESHKSTSTI